MGQNIVAVMYGIKTDDAFMASVRDTEDGDPIWAIPGNYEIERHLQHSVVSDAIGFVVASYLPEDGEGEIQKSSALADFETNYAGPLERAKGLWGAFAAFLTDHGRAYPQPDLLLTVIEVA